MKLRNNTKSRFFTVLLICLLLSASVLLGACDETSEHDRLFSSSATTRRTNATRATLATVEIDETPVPHLVPEISEENTKLVIGRLSEPVVRPINSKVNIQLRYQGWPTVCAGDGNTLYAVSSVRLTHIDPFGCIGFYKSEDGGQTWSDVEIIADTPIDDRDAGIVYLGENRVLVSWFTHDVSNYTKGGAWYDSWANHENLSKEQHDAVLKKLANLPPTDKQAGSYVMLSSDGGKTWEAPVQVPVSAPHGPTLMRDGKTLIYFGDLHNPSACGESGLNGNRFYVYTSTDCGKTWRQLSSLGLPTVSGFMYDEPHILQLRDGSYIAAIRGQKISGSNDSLSCFIAHSSDGRKWSNFEALKGTVGTPPHFFQTKEGILVISYSYRLDPCGARGRISYDNGYTWSDEIIFSKSDTPWDGDLGYASTTQLPDGTMITAYYQKKGEDTYCSLLFTRWKLVEDAGAK